VSRFKDTGVTFYEEDREKGPFIIRIGGTSEFVSDLEARELRQTGGKIEVVEGWGNRRALKFETMDAAIKAAVQVWKIEGFHTLIEATGW